MNTRISEEELLSIALKSFKVGLNVSLPAKIVSFDPITTRATVRLAIQKVPIQGEPYTVSDLHEIPIMIQQSGGYAITIPIKADDECVVIFSQRDISSWKQNGAETAPNSKRIMDISDAVCIIGFQNNKSVVSDFNNDAIEIRNKDNTIHLQVSDIGIAIKGNVSIEGDLEVTGDIKTPTGDIVAQAGEVTAKTVDLSTHTHLAGLLLDSLASPVTGSTAVPIP